MRVQHVKTCATSGRKEIGLKDGGVSRMPFCLKGSETCQTHTTAQWARPLLSAEQPARPPILLCLHPPPPSLHTHTHRFQDSTALIH